MYQMWKTTIVNRHIVRLKVLAVLLIYTLVTGTVIQAGVVKRDISNASVVTLVGNGTTETPATTVPIRSERDGRVGAGETSGNIIVLNNHKSIGLNDKSLQHHEINVEDELISFDEPDDTLVERSSYNLPLSKNETSIENAVEQHNVNQTRTDATTPIINVSDGNATSTTVTSTVGLTTSTTKTPLIEKILPEKLVLSESINKFAEYKQFKVESLRNNTSDSDVTNNDIKDDDPKAKNITNILPKTHSAIELTETSTATTVELNEKRSKSLVDLRLANKTSSTDELLSHKVVGELNTNNVTLGRTNEFDGKSTDTVQSGGSANISISLHEQNSTNANAEGLLNGSMLKNNSSRIDNTVNQDISIVQVTTVAPRTNRIASITRKEVESTRMGDVMILNGTAVSNVTNERIVKVENSQSSIGHLNDPNKITNPSDDKKLLPVQIYDNKNNNEKQVIGTTAASIAETTETVAATEVTTTDVNEGTTMETPEETTIFDEPTTTNIPLTSTVPPQTSVGNRSAALTERTIPKKTVLAAEMTTPAVPDVETTPIYSTTQANRKLEVEEVNATIIPETTVLPTERRDDPSSIGPLKAQGSTLIPAFVTSGPTKPMDQFNTTIEQTASASHTTIFTTTTTGTTTTTTTAIPTSTSSVTPSATTSLTSSAPSSISTTSPELSTTTQSTTANKMKLMEISTTEISLNRLEDKYSTEVDKKPPENPTSLSNFEDPLEESTFGIGDEGQDTSSETPISANNSLWESLDVNAIIAVGVSVVGIIALILLVGFLFIMRKRQKQMTYGQRCRPVGLDAYSLDNISVYNSVRRKGTIRSSKRAYGNVGFDDPALKNNLLNISALATFAQRRATIYDEFKDVPLVTARIDEVPAGCEDKNRYANVVPLPESRVILKRIGDDDRTEYINANYVKGPKDTTHYYIACQAPLENTIIDFWRMIWEQNSRVIIMATDLTENGIEKCADYLPPSFIVDNQVIFGDYQITLKNREVKEKYAVSSLHLKNTVTKTWREITHLWYQWPENGTPTDEASIIAMLLETRSYLKMNLPEQGSGNVYESSDADLGNGSVDKHKSLQRVQGPLTVHCSPGTGRTGTIIACDIAIRALEQPTRSVDVPQIVYVVRRGRASAVQTREQYEFIYKVAHMYATKLTGPISEN